MNCFFITLFLFERWRFVETFRVLGRRGPFSHYTGGRAAVAGDKIGKNSGGTKVAHTSYSGPNWRRNKSENERSNTNTGSKITVLIYGIAAMQQVAQVT